MKLAHTERNVRLEENKLLRNKVHALQTKSLAEGRDDGYMLLGDVLREIDKRIAKLEVLPVEVSP